MGRHLNVLTAAWGLMYLRLKLILKSNGDKGLQECPSEAETGSVMTSWVMGHVNASRRPPLLCWFIAR